MATPRRRSTRLSRKSATPERSAVNKLPQSEDKLGTLLERDETPEIGTEAQPTLNEIFSTPIGPPNTQLQDRLAQLSALKTPTTAPRPSHAEMHPKDAHRSTLKSPDSASRLGFVDAPENQNKSLAEKQNTPTKAQGPTNIPNHLIPAGFEFKFASDSTLSSEAQKLMDNVREEAARIKEQMKLEREEQHRKDGEAENMFEGVNGAGRKIAKPKGKAGRFSDVHMAEFKKMDSIANHASGFRARPGFLQSTEQSLKRSGSKAGLDEQERPCTAGKTTSPAKYTHTPWRRSPVKRSPVKTSTAIVQEDSGSPVKRARYRGPNEAYETKGRQPATEDSPTVSQLRSGFGFSSNLLTPTKASLARSAMMKDLASSPGKPSIMPRLATLKDLSSSPDKLSTLPRSTSVKTLRSPLHMKPPPNPHGRLTNNSLMKRAEDPVFAESPSHSAQNINTGSTSRSANDRPLPPLPTAAAIGSKLPKFSGLKSILRRHQPLFSNDPIKIAAGTHVASPSGGLTINNHLTNLSSDGVGTPDRRLTLGPAAQSTKKRVEFASSPKSKYDLALASPSPSKIPGPRPEKRPDTPFAPSFPYNSAAYVINDVQYPQLHLDSSSNPSSPPAALPPQAVKKVQQQVVSRDSPDFKSIFTTLHPRPPPKEPSSNTRKSRSPSSSPFKPSPSTIRHVRESDLVIQNATQPFEDLQTVPHGLPGKKRRRESNDQGDDFETGPSKGNRRFSAMPLVPGGFPIDSPQYLDGPTAKRRKMPSINDDADADEIRQQSPTKENVNPSPTKKPNAARTAASNAAKERKGKGFLTMSRLNMLSQPKDRK